MATGREGEARDAVRDAAPATTTTRDGEATTRWIGRGETREEGGERGKGATATRRARDARDLERRLGFLVSLWMACVSRVTPQIALAGVVGAGRAVVETVGVRRDAAVLDDVSVRFYDRSALRGVGGAVVLAGVSRGAGV